MRSIAILGAGAASATLARRLAEMSLARRILLVDRDQGTARGKALDIAQSGPVEGSDSQVEGAAEATGTFDAVVIGDPVGGEPIGTKDLLRSALPLLGDAGLLLVLGAEPWGLIEMTAAFGVPRGRALGSVPVALAAAVRQRLALELDAGVRDVTTLVLGRPPHLVVPADSVLLAGIPVHALSPVALRRAQGEVVARRLGPVALAAAAARVLRGRASARACVLPVALRLDGEYGHRGPALAVPVRLGGGRVEVIEMPLCGAERIAFDNGVGRRTA